MPDGAWVALAATFLGGVIAVAGAWFNGRTQSTREHARLALDQRRAAYVEYLYRSQDLYRYLDAAVRELSPTIGPGRPNLLPSAQRAAELTAELDSRYVQHRRAQVTVGLVAPQHVEDMVDARALEAKKATDAMLLALSERDPQLFPDAFHLIRTLIAATGTGQLREAMKEDLAR
jgi:hypothetical protein